MRDRLVELLKKADKYASGVCTDYDEAQEVCAEYLRAEGVIVPPYKPLPLIDEGESMLCPICENDLMGCYIGYEESPNVVTCYGCGSWIDNTKAVTREEAEKALKGRSDG